MFDDDHDDDYMNCEDDDDDWIKYSLHFADSALFLYQAKPKTVAPVLLPFNLAWHIHSLFLTTSKNT